MSIPLQSTNQCHETRCASTGAIKPRAGWYKRIVAASIAKGSASYNQVVADRKQALLSNLHGEVLEIGAGSGPNLGFLPHDVHYTGIEPNPYMHNYLRAAAQQIGLAIDIRSGTAEQLAVADNSLDAVMSTLVLCSVGDQEQVLREVRRALKPDGRFVFLEHVAAPQGTRLRRTQNVLQPIWSLFSDGCHPNRETWAAIEQAGFSQVHLQHFNPIGGLMGPHIAGTAIK